MVRVTVTVRIMVNARSRVLFRVNVRAGTNSRVSVSFRLGEG